jgi:S-DNA-T family DNA segregation ATPase FtsK/SpoIIIE
MNMTDHDDTIDAERLGTIAEVTGSSDHGADAQAAMTSPALLLGRRAYPLKPGANVVGRSEDTDVRLQSSSVSRRHARIEVGPSGAVVEDLRSRNGTTAGDTRIVAPTKLSDGDAVRFGAVWLVYRSPSEGGSNDER